MAEDPGYYRRVSDILERTRDRLPAARRPSFHLDGRGKGFVRVVLLSLCGLLVLLYAADSISARIRLARGDLLGTVKIERLGAIPQKGGRTEFVYGGSETQNCVHSLFPHFDHPPCWYARRHTEQRTDY